MPSSPIEERLSEDYVQDCFHTYIQNSLKQAQVEKLLSTARLANATEGDLMIIGPALCLYFAALRCQTDPPSVPLPKRTKTASGSGTFELTQTNCPPAFTSFLNVWAANVQLIRTLNQGTNGGDKTHDLARLICGLEPLQGPDSELSGIAADLRAVAIEISQRRSFQERYSGDLQAAIDAQSEESGSGGVKLKASFTPPPAYDPSPSSSQESSPRYQQTELPPDLSVRTHPHMYQPPSSPPQSPGLLTPNFNTQPLSPIRSRSRTPSPARSEGGGNSSSSAGPSARTVTRTPTLVPDVDTLNAIDIIRQTLYASLGDVLERTPSLRALLKRDKARGYFAAVAFAILEVSTTSTTSDGSIIGIMSKEIRLDKCPPPLRAFMKEVVNIGEMAKEVEERDTEEAMRLAMAGEDIPPPRMERVKKILEEGVHLGDGRRSVEGRTVAFANRINALALAITRLKAFTEREKGVFDVLMGITNTPFGPR